jgi:hypothetical protein
MRQRAAYELDGIQVVLILPAPALGGRTDGENHPKQPVFCAPDWPWVFLVEVADEGMQRGSGEGWVKGEDACLVELDECSCSRFRRKTGSFGFRNGLICRGCQDQPCKGHVGLGWIKVAGGGIHSSATD